MARNGKFLELLAARVACGETIAAAAEEIGCSRSHAYTLSSSIEFRRRVGEVRSEALAAAVGRLSDGAAKAVDALIELLDRSSDPAHRIAAAKAILAAVGPVSELAELRARLDTLERHHTTTSPRLAR